MKVADRGRVLPARRRPGARRLGAPPDPGRARRRRRGPGARPAPPAAAAGRAAALRSWPRSAASSRQPATAELDGVRRRLPALPVTAAAVELRSWGAWAAPVLARAAPAAARLPLRPRPRPLRRPRRRCRPARAARACRWSSRSTAAMSTAGHAGAPAVRRRWPTPGWCSPTAPARLGGARRLGRGGDAGRSPRHRPRRTRATAGRAARRWSPSGT